MKSTRIDSGCCRVIVDPQAASGAWNMAVDEALLESAVAGGPCTVRWYRWERPTLSLGYFQARDEARLDPRWAALPVVRRLSGGGAIVHHHELTYSCTVPVHSALAHDARQLYTRVHECIISTLAAHGFAAALRGSADPGRGKDFLCFGRADDFDVVMEGHKVLGSAQRRRKGAVLQHGSLVLRRSECASQFPGVFDCAGHAVPVEQLIERLSLAVGGLFATRLEHGTISDDERASALKLVQST
jgi:lipoate-protein ligase A